MNKKLTFILIFMVALLTIIPLNSSASQRRRTAQVRCARFHTRAKFPRSRKSPLWENSSASTTKRSAYNRKSHGTAVA
jgi:hypothetical protein